MAPAAERPQPEPPSTETADYFTFDDWVGHFFEPEPRISLEVTFGATTHEGKVRDHNEDHYMIVRRQRQREIIKTSLVKELLPAPEQSAYVLAVADGMGGHAFGELASYLALRTGWDLGTDEVKWSLKTNAKEADELKRKATVIFRQIDRRLHEEAAREPRLTGMGTTLTLCYTIGLELFVFHAGDSRAYLYRDGVLTQLTHDHTVGQALVDAGLAPPDSPEVRRRRHALTNCLGGPSLGISVDVDHRRLAPGDRLMLCTDGLSDMVDDPLIADVLGRVADPEAACLALRDMALDHGGKDNVTVILADFASGSP